MAQHGQQYGRQTDEYGNPIRQNEEHGGTNMGQQHGTTGAAIGGGDYGGEQLKTSGGGIGQHGTTGGAIGGGGYGGEQVKTTSGVLGGGGGMGTGVQHKEHQGQGILNRSGSGSSSSSEDDGEGGRRKKGITQKIKEKLPGGNKGQEHEPMQGTATTGYGQDDPKHHGTTATGYGHEGQQEEKKGMMDKIKEKLPGGQN